MMLKVRKQSNDYLNESGYSLVGVLLMVVLISVLGLGLLTITTTSVKTTTSERSDQSAFYIAEAGATVKMAEVEKIVADVFKESKDEKDFYSKLNGKILKKTTLSNDFFEDAYGETKANVIVEPGETDHTYRITSIGSIGKQKRTVERMFTVEFKPPSGGAQVKSGVAAFVNNTVTMDGSAAIIGDVATKKSGANSIIIKGNPSIRGSIFVPPGSEQKAINKPDWMTNFPKPVGTDIGDLLELPPFPIFPDLPLANEPLINLSGGNNKTYVLNHSQKFKEIKVQSNLTLYLDVGEHDKEIIVDKLELPSGHIKIRGSGKLTIYITDQLSFDRGSSIIAEEEQKKEKEETQVNIFLKGSQNPSNPKTVKLAGSQKLYASLYAEDANIEFTASGGFKGNLFTGGKSVKLSGDAMSSSPLLLAPHANIEFTGSGKLGGVVVAHSLYMDGGTSLNYQQMKFPKGDISIEGLGKNVPGTFEITRKPLREQ